MNSPAEAPALLTISDFSDASGGATKVAADCVRAAAAAGMRVGALYGDDGPADGAAPSKLEVVALDQSALRQGLRRGDVVEKLYNMRAARALQGLLRRLGPRTVVHVHTWAQILSPAIFYALKRANARVIVTAHDFFLSCPNGGYINYQTGAVCELTPLSARCLATHCDKRHYSHKAWRAQRTALQFSVGHNFWKNVLVIMAHEAMEAPLRRFTGLNRFVELRSPTRAFFTTPVDVAKNHGVAFLGRMTWEKGVHVLAEALESLGRGGVFIGQGPLLEQVRRSAPRSEALGWRSAEEASQRLRQARVFVMPSLMPEPYGLTAVEAMMSGLPVIVSDACLIAHEIREAGAGVTFRSGDAQDLAAAIRKFDDDAFAARTAEAALAFSLRIAPTRDEWAKRLIDIYATEMARA